VTGDGVVVIAHDPSLTRTSRADRTASGWRAMGRRCPPSPSTTCSAMTSDG
jgi:hypothetical protein